MLTNGYHPHIAALLLLSLAHPASAQNPHGAGAQGGNPHRGAPTGQAHGGTTETPVMDMPSKEKAERRFPQPVRVGDLVGRQVLEPSNHQGVIGRVDGVTRVGEGEFKLVVRYGGLLGFGTRTIAIPIEATALLGQYVQVVDLDRDKLKALPDWAVGTGAAVPADERIRIGINRN